MNNPLVSIICLNYNQGAYISQALDSALDQTYRNFELIVVDDNSSDDSEEIIKHYKRLHPEIEIFLLAENVGNCKAFNIGLQASSGKYVIDLAADDILFPERVQQQVEALESLGDQYTMCFTDAVHINEKGEILKNHYRRNKNGQLLEKVPSGDVYRDVLERFFISAPTMMMNAEHLKAMGGYDESLSYEDFDYWVRFSRVYKFHYLDKVLTGKRLVTTSQSQMALRGEKPNYERDTLIICKKAYKLNQNTLEHKSLAKRLKYEMRQSYFKKNYRVTLGYAKLLKKIGLFNTPDSLIASLAKKKIDVSSLYKSIKKTGPQ